MLTDWDDLRFCLAVARNRSLRDAATELGVHHATVSRRIRAFEERLGTRVFDRTPEGYIVTAAGADVISRGHAVEEQFHSLERTLKGRERNLSGVLRISAIRELTIGLSPQFASFCELYPGIELDVASSNAYADLDRREADVAVRIASAPSVHLEGRRIGRVGIAPYASLPYLARNADRALSEHAWLAWSDEFENIPMQRWLTKNVASQRVRCRYDDLSSLRAGVEAGVGVGHLLCYVADRNPLLRRVGPPLEDDGLYLWVLNHPDLRNSAPVRAFVQHLGDALTADRELLEGQRPQTLDRIAAE